jgi:hypothetical protein
VNVRRVLEGLIVVVALFVGTTASAFAHAGHSHAQPASVAMPASVISTTTPTTVVQKSSDVIPLFATLGGARADMAHPGDPLAIGTQRPENAPCTPGTCGCQGASMCGTGGHCCASMMPESMHWAPDYRDHMRYHLARLGWVYPDVVFGLDRPPKA